MPKSKETISESESDSSSGSVEEVESKPKSKPRKEQKKKQESSSAESSDSETDSKSRKRPKKSNDKGNAKKQKKNNDGDEIWDLGGNKQVTVRNFRGKWFVDIREMYEKDGKMNPGKKGICMNLDNWRELYKVFEEVNDCVKSKC